MNDDVSAAARSPKRAFAAVSLFGELLATAGAVLLLFGVYTLVWTNVRANAEARQEVRRLQQDFQAPTPPTPDERSPFDGTAAFALLHLPRLGPDWVQPVVRGSGTSGTGIELEDLTGGVAHYPRTARPGEKGNFALAGHRATHGEPFRDLDRLQPGDPAIVRTRENWLVYVVTRQEIVPANALDVLLPVPRRPGLSADTARMTLTTCHPRWGSSHRLVVYTELRERRPPESPPVELSPAG